MQSLVPSQPCHLLSTFDNARTLSATLRCDWATCGNILLHVRSRRRNPPPSPGPRFRRIDFELRGDGAVVPGRLEDEQRIKGRAMPPALPGSMRTAAWPISLREADHVI